jgi:hypothetical protein
MKKKRLILNLLFLIPGLMIVYILNYINLSKLPIVLPDSTVLALSVAYVLLWMVFSLVAGMRRGKAGWYIIVVYWIVIPALLILLTGLFASFQSVTAVLASITNLLYINVLRGFNDLVHFGIDLFQYFSSKGYPVVPAILCLLSYAIGRLFTKPRFKA